MCLMQYRWFGVRKYFVLLQKSCTFAPQFVGKSLRLLTQ